MFKRLWSLVLVVSIAAFVCVCTESPSSDEELKVKALADGFTAASARFVRAARAMGGLGMDTTSEAEAAVVEVKKIRRELAGLMTTLTEERATGKAGELKAKIDDFCRKNDIE